MTDSTAVQRIADARQLAASLRAFGVALAPATLAPTVLTRLGLADSYLVLTTPVGVVFVAYNDAGISAVERAVEATDFERTFRQRFARPALPASDTSAETSAQFVQTLEACLRGERRPKDVLQFDLRGLTDFERAVLLKALEIPRGEVRPYAWVAREIGHPQAVRAVGNALGHNPIPLFIPCHRVVRSDGTFGQYSLGGDANKRTLLAAEGLVPATLEALAQAGVRFTGNDTTHVYCFPTCSHVRQITPAHRTMFRSAHEAAAAGYRPCTVCRPAAQAS